MKWHGLPPQVLSLTRHAGAEPAPDLIRGRIQGREGMAIGFRRYDGTFVPSRRPDHPCTWLFEGARRTRFLPSVEM